MEPIMSCVAPSIHHSSLKEAIELKTIAKTLGYGALKGLVPFWTQPITENTDPLDSFKACIILGTLEKFGSDLAADWISKQKSKSQDILPQNAEMIHLVSELGCKIIVWGAAVMLGFVTLPTALTGGVLTGSITLARRLDSSLYYESKKIDNVGRFILYWVPIFMSSQVALGNLARAYTSLFQPYTTSLAMLSFWAFWINVISINVIHTDQHPDDPPSVSLMFRAADVINNGQHRLKRDCKIKPL
jgi:hypothetical protein